MGEFFADNWYFFAGGLAIVILVGILIFLRMRRKDE
ncbi:MAG TPA: GGIII-like transmembrane region-containing protein [Gemmataceae bacterium]|nr:GGIII-like transmembrane region-containing protein [Gemmataceae bacterium]